MSSESPDVSTLLILNSELEATIIADALKDRGIDAEVAGGLTGGFRAEAPGSVKVLVRTEDFARAKAALEAYREEAADIDWSKVDVGRLEE